MRHAYIDVHGTLVHHLNMRPIPLMDDFLRAIHDQGWCITIFSSYPSAQCTHLLSLAGVSLPLGTRILSSFGRDKGEVLLADLDGQSADETIFLDDKPQNLHLVKSACKDRVRVIGLVGSRKYVPALSKWCASSRVELALSAVDLCEGLGVSLGHYSSSDFEKFSEGDIISLIPGLDHPMSATAGETAHFDQRRIVSMLFEYKKLKNFEEFWSNLGWITCNECLWKALVESVLLAKSLPRDDVLGDAYKDYEYTVALKEFAKQNPAFDLKSTFETSMKWIQSGIRKLGVDAENCRISNRSLEKKRLQAMEHRIRDSFE
jgi:hypothetical protein